MVLFLNNSKFMVLTIPHRLNEKKNGTEPE